MKKKSHSKKLNVAGLVALMLILLTVSLNFISSERKITEVGNPEFFKTGIFDEIVTNCQTDGQDDPRLPAECVTLSDELAPAIGRLRKGTGSSPSICTGWIAQGGILITAEHCDKEWSGGLVGAVFEFDVYDSQSDGKIVPSDPENQYVVTEILYRDDEDGTGYDNDEGEDWLIFKVANNTITGYQPIQAQLTYINFVRPDVSNSNIPTVRLIGYSRDALPFGSGCCGTNPNTRNYTLQTDDGPNLTTGSSPDKIRYNTFSSGGASGAPVIDEATGNAIGVHNSTSGGAYSGTSLHRDQFWTDFQSTQTNLTLSVYQKSEANSNISGSKIGHWTGSSFSESYVDGSSGATKLTISTQVGNVEVLRGDQNVFNNPKEKFNLWANQEDVRNHQRFQMEPGVTQLISQFQKTYSGITVKNYYPEYSSYNAGGQVKFKDPWLIDYADPDFDNVTRNRGKNAEFVTQNSPFSPGFSAINGKLYNGLFLNENNFFDPDLNNYSVRHDDSPATESFGGSLGNRQLVFHEWTGVNADFEDSDEEETGVVFTSSTAEARANLKIQGVTSVTANNGATGQRKIVRTSDGFLHRVYESLGHVWYETKSPTGDWEIISTIGGRLTVDETGGKSPSIDANYSIFPKPNSVTIAWQEGSNIKMRVYNAYNGSYTWYVENSISSGMSSSYDTKPHIIWTGTNEFGLFWQTSSGIKYNIYKFGGAAPNYSDYILIDSGTVSGTSSSSVNAAISADKDFPYSIYELAWVQNGTGGASSIKYKYVYTDGSTAYQYPTTPITVSSSSDFSNTNVSIMTTPDYAVIGWACRSTSYWSPMSSRACVRTYDGASLSSFSTFNQSVASVSVAKVGTGNDYYFAWSEKYYYPESQYNNDVNKYVKKGAFSNKRTLNTTAPNIQLYHAPSGNDMKLSAFYSGTPKYYVLSNSLETTSKAASETSLQARGIHVNKKDEAGAYFEIGSILIDNEPIQFVEIPEVVTGENRFNRTQNKDSLIEKKLEDVTPFLISEPFNLSEESSFTYTEQFSIGDSLALTNVLGKNGELSFSLELVNEGNTRVVATLKSVKMSSKSLRSQKEKGYQVNIPKELNGRFRIRITPESNLEDFSFELATSYKDDSSQSGKEKTKLDLEGVNIILDYELAQNYPNPFNPSTQIEYQIPNAGLVQLEVFDILGRKVQTLVNETKEVGKYTVTFDASGLASGVYLYRLTSGKFMASKKLFLVK